MITVFACTNRIGSNTLKVAKHYLQLLENQGAQCQLYSLTMLPETVAFSETYGNRSDGFAQHIEQYVSKAEKFVFVMPEYNGGFPGVLKLFIDAIPPKEFHGKRAGLVGLSAGHTGALRPLDQFSNLLDYIQVDCIHDKPKLSSIDSLIDDDDRLVDERALRLLASHAEKMAAL